MSSRGQLSPDESLRFIGVTKDYRKGGGAVWSGDLRDDVGALFRRVAGREKTDGRERLRALDDVSFAVRRGENVGIVGPNGAGKSTILKVLARITRPTRGEALVRGRVAALIQLGAGFHRELTGRENVYLYGAILGLSRRQVDERFERILDFAELEDFADTPLKHFSSGMKVRLGFSVAANVDPDVLLVDEVLAVGDRAFRHKCLDWMRARASTEASLVFVSHQHDLFETLCDRCILLDRGRVVSDGPTAEVLAQYEERVDARAS